MSNERSSGGEPPLPAWGHGCGMLALGEAVVPGDACAVADRLLFSERIARYCWAYDERRLDRLVDCFADDGIWEGKVLGRIAIGPFCGRAAIGAWLSEFWPHQRDQRRHMILNTIVEDQSGDHAVTLSYLLLLASDGAAVTIETTGFYRVEYRHEGAVWRIARLTAGFDAPFWRGDISAMSKRGRTRHGVHAEES